MTTTNNGRGRLRTPRGMTGDCRASARSRSNPYPWGEGGGRDRARACAPTNQVNTSGAAGEGAEEGKKPLPNQRAHTREGRGEPAGRLSASRNAEFGRGAAGNAGQAGLRIKVGIGGCLAGCGGRRGESPSQRHSLFAGQSERSPV